MSKSFPPHIELIRTALAHIGQYQPADEATFLASPMVQDAILMRLQEIGENLSRMRHIDEEQFIAADDDSWFQLIGLRNVISHGYHQIKPEQIWQIVTEELPIFAATIDDFAGRV
ncbi:MAG: HepT-like ribonuclease domain-containing protein [Thermomicrobiales bacterium]